MFAPSSLSARADLAVKVAQTINAWAGAEAEMGQLLRSVTGGDARASMAMFLALQSAPAKLAALDAAVEVTLKGDQLRIYTGIMRLARRAAKQRHKFAHHIWGHCLELPDALLLIDPVDQLRKNLDVLTGPFAEFVAEWMPQSTGVFRDIPSDDPIENRYVYVYRDADFDCAIKECHDVAHMLRDLRWSIEHQTRWNNPELAAQVLQRLLSRPELLKELPPKPPEQTSPEAQT